MATQTDRAEQTHLKSLGPSPYPTDLRTRQLEVTIPESAWMSSARTAKQRRGIQSNRKLLLVNLVLTF